MAVLLLFGPATTAAASLSMQDKEFMLLDGVNPLNPFPAGLEAVPALPYVTQSHYTEPPVPANGYRGVYVSVCQS